MKCRNILLGGATLLALSSTVVLISANAQTPNTPASQSMQPALPSPDSDATAPSTTAVSHHHHAMHHPRHHGHMRTAATESGSERKATDDLNKQQLDQGKATMPGPSGQMGQPGQMGQNPPNAMGPGAMQGQAAPPRPADTNTNVGPTHEPDPNAATVGNPSQQGGPGGPQSNNAGQTSSSMVAENTVSSPMTRPTGATENVSAPAANGEMAVSQVQNAQQTLASAKVKGSGGQALGTVSQVQSDANGTPTKVEVKLDPAMGMGERSVWINADKLQYQPQNNALSTELTPAQLSTM
ncbi:MAG TPA: hypothetical protein VII49_12455 [Rhizomicrobium sp.]